MNRKSVTTPQRRALAVPNGNGRLGGSPLPPSPFLLEFALKQFRNIAETILSSDEDTRQQDSRMLFPPTNEGQAMSKLLDLLYQEYTRSRLAEMAEPDGFADIWRQAHRRRADDVAHLIRSLSATVGKTLADGTYERTGNRAENGASG